MLFRENIMNTDCWFVIENEPSPNSMAYTVVDEYGEIICFCDDLEKAHLISASPAMLDAIETTLSQAKRVNEQISDMPPSMKQLVFDIHVCRLAISKAKGLLWKPKHSST